MLFGYPGLLGYPVPFDQLLVEQIDEVARVLSEQGRGSRRG